MEIETILAITAAVVLEEMKKSSERTQIAYADPAGKGKLAQYIEENNIPYHKYQLGDELL